MLKHLMAGKSDRISIIERQNETVIWKTSQTNLKNQNREGFFIILFQIKKFVSSRSTVDSKDEIIYAYCSEQSSPPYLTGIALTKPPNNTFLSKITRKPTARVSNTQTLKR